jgi:hypothetical protein
MAARTRFECRRHRDQTGPRQLRFELRPKQRDGFANLRSPLDPDLLQRDVVALEDRSANFSLLDFGKELAGL